MNYAEVKKICDKIQNGDRESISRHEIALHYRGIFLELINRNLLDDELHEWLESMRESAIETI